MEMTGQTLLAIDDHGSPDFVPAAGGVLVASARNVSLRALRMGRFNA
jgi:hypothetical protein